MTYLMKKVTQFAAVVCVLGFASVQALASDVDTLTQKLESIRDLSGTFTQKIHDDTNTLVEQTTGEFKLKRPGYFMWQTLPPYEQLIVSNTQNLYVYEPDLEQVTVYAADKISQTPAGILTSKSASIAAFFNVTMSKNADQESFKLTYKSQDNQDFTWLDIVFEKNKLTQLSILDKLNQTTSVVFSNLDNTVVLTPSMFDFSPPKGVDIINN